MDSMGLTIFFIKQTLHLIDDMITNQKWIFLLMDIYLRLQ
jgi:hypothetical protein